MSDIEIKFRWYHILLVAVLGILLLPVWIPLLAYKAMAEWMEEPRISLGRDHSLYRFRRDGETEKRLRFLEHTGISAKHISGQWYWLARSSRPNLMATEEQLARLRRVLLEDDGEVERGVADRANKARGLRGDYGESLEGLRMLERLNLGVHDRVVYDRANPKLGESGLWAERGIAIIHRDVPDEDVERIGRLLSGAPGLLSAAKAALDYSTIPAAQFTEKHGHMNKRDVLERLEAAIANAEGRD